MFTNIQREREKERRERIDNSKYRIKNLFIFVILINKSGIKNIFI